MINQTEYIPGVHCGDKDCYACATQRHSCDELEKLDSTNVEPTDAELADIENNLDDFDLGDLFNE